MKRLLFCLAFLAAALFPLGPAGAVTYSGFSVPGADSTFIYGIDGNNLVGEYSVGDAYHGFIYNGSTVTTFDYPGARGTSLRAISGSTVVGYGGSKLFTYSGGTITDLPPINNGTIGGVSGSTIVGKYIPNYPANLITQGFIYNGSTVAPFSAPGATETLLADIDGGRILGAAKYGGSTAPWQYFIYDGTSFTSLSFPVTISGLAALDGDKMAGTYGGMFGFVYDGTTFVKIEYPGSRWTWIWGLSGNRVIGDYIDAEGNGYPFIARLDEFEEPPPETVPEPITLILLGSGLAGAAAFRRARK